METVTNFIDAFSIIGIGFFLLMFITDFIRNYQRKIKRKHQDELQLQKNKLDEIEIESKLLIESVTLLARSTRLITRLLGSQVEDIETLKAENQSLLAKTKNLQKQLNYLKRKCRNSSIN